MAKEETIFETYARTVCSICKNKEQCNEELHKRIDGSIKCDSFITTFVPKLNVETLRYSTKL